MKNKLSIVIVNWNTPNYLKKLLRLLFGDFGFEIIVVDNASNKPLDWVKKKYPEVFLIQNKFNRGYAAACNQGVLKAVGEWVLFLNPDVEITPRQIKQLVSYAEKNNLDACSVKTTDSYQKPLPSWLTLLIEFTPLNQVSRFLPRRYVGVEMTWGAKTLFGGCLLIKKSVIMSLGGFDERFFLWFEDSDLTKRLVEKTFKIGWAPLKIKHEGGISFKQLSNQFKRDIFFHSMDVYAKKHFNYFGQTVINLIKKGMRAENLSYGYSTVSR